MIRILHLHVCFVYFDQMQAGTKPFEYREATVKNIKLLEKEYDQVWIYRGYPSKADIAANPNLIRKCHYQGRPAPTTITHEHFKNKPTKVFPIDVTQLV